MKKDNALRLADYNDPMIAVQRFIEDKIISIPFFAQINLITNAKKLIKFASRMRARVYVFANKLRSFELHNDFLTSL